jgi:phenylacetate-CoA ligase
MAGGLQRAPAAAIKPPFDLRGWPETFDLRLGRELSDHEAFTYIDLAPEHEIRAFQFLRAAAMLAHLQAHSPWWRRRLEGLRPGEPWTALPRMDRTAFREAAAAGPVSLPPAHGVVSDDVTSGSSGVPMRFYVSELWKRLNRHHHGEDCLRHGLDGHAVQAAIEVRRRPGIGSGVLKATAQRFQRDARAFTVEQHAAWLSQVKPRYLTTAPLILEGMLDAFEAGRAAPPALDAVVLYGETVTPELRRRARAILGARLIDRYCSQDVGPLAFQCPRREDRHHVQVTNVIMEILDEQGRPVPPGEVGRVHVTGLHNWASPSLRYEIGDLAAWRRGCECGFQGMTLTRLLGRIAFLVRLPSGERKLVYIPQRRWLAAAPVRESRIVQVTEGLIKAEVAPQRPLTDDERAALLALCREEISPELAYELVELQAIDWGPTYKRQDVVSLV